jgi:hypothetical protein
MKALRIVFFLGLSLLFMQASQAQQLRSIAYPRFYRPVMHTADKEKGTKSGEEEVQRSNEVPVNERFQFGMSIGTGFTSGGGASMSSSYLAPEVTYWASPKLRIDFQGFIQKNSMLNNNGIFPGYGGMNNTNMFGFAGQGNYALTNRVSLHGNALYSEFPNAMVYNRQGMYANSNAFTSVSLGVNYKISEKVQLGFSMGFNNGNNPYYYPMNALNPMMVQEPFGTDNPFRQHPW